MFRSRPGRISEMLGEKGHTPRISPKSPVSTSDEPPTANPHNIDQSGSDSQFRVGLRLMASSHTLDQAT